MPRIEPTFAASNGQPSKTPPPPPPGRPASSAGVAATSPAASRRPSRTRDGSNSRPGTAVSSAPPSSRSSALTRARRRVAAWLDALVHWSQDVVEAIGSPRGGLRLHEFADLVGTAREPERIETALAALAGEVAGAIRVELLLDRDEASPPAPRLLAVWPTDAPALTAEQLEALGYPLCLGLWCGDHSRMSLQLYAPPDRRKRWPRRIVRRLTTLCSIAAMAERGLHAGRRSRFTAADDGAAPSSASVRDATFLNAVLPYALSQARRHREPLSVFCIEIDRLSALRRSRGGDVAGEVVRRVAEAIARALRGSDVVARLDDDRIIVVLPNTGPADALTVAAAVRPAIADARRLPDAVPALSVSIGVAGFPHDAREMIALLAAADEALARARSLGPNQTAAHALPPP